MKKILLIISTCILGSFLMASNISVDLSFQKADIISNGDYQLIKVEDCLDMGSEGEPLLPWKGIDILLPQGEEVNSINIINIQYYDPMENVLIQPAVKPVPISNQSNYTFSLNPNPRIYNNNSDYPTNNISTVNTNYLAGHSIASFSFCPVQYNPVQGVLSTVKSVSFEVVTNPISRNDIRKAKISPEIEARINTIVMNPEMISMYNYNNNLRIDEYDILLISSDELLVEFDEYVDFKTSTGWIVKTISTSEIYTLYDGVDNPGKIRNCIIDYYENYNIGYVILGGDTDNNVSQIVVPHRAFSVLDDPTMPSDIYYACLDGDWDTNNNGTYGEAGEMDPYAEVYVGRICVDSAIEIQNFTNKLRMYQEFPVVDDIEKALMVGEELNDDPWTFGGDYKDQIVDGGTYDGYTTTGLSSNFTTSTLYERDYEWPSSDLYNQFNNNGVHLLNHLGHSNPTYNMKMTNSDINSVNINNNGIDRGYAIGYSQGCYNGSFDNWHFSGYYTEDCFAEKMTTFEYGEVACIANSRYGWYMPGGTNSSSQYYDRQFFHAIFGNNHSLIGDVNHLSKEVDVSYAQGDSYYRWVFYETNLFGDPTMDIWTAAPVDLVPDYASAIPVGSLQISVNCGVEGARVALIQDGELLGRALADESGVAIVDFDNPVTTVTPIDISIIAHNRNRFTGTIYVSADQPYIVQNDVTVVDSGNENGIPDYTESVDLNIEFMNLGQQDGDNLNAVITTEDEYVTITQDQCSLGSIASGDSINIDAAFAFTVDSFIPDRHVVYFTINVTGSNGEAGLSYFTLQLAAPDLAAGNVEVIDYIGDNNGNLDPGETATFSFPINNDGLGDSPILSTALEVDDELITIEIASNDLGIIGAGESATVSYNVTASELLEEGTPVIFNLIVSAETITEYGFENSYPHVIGFVYDSFESGDFNAYAWEQSGDAPWTISVEDPYDGTYCARSGSIGANQRTALNLELDVLVESEMSFFVKISSENNFDFLKFTVDGTPMESWSGEVNWLASTHTLSSGHHQLSWVYEKDQYSSDGSDCAWLDFVVMPVVSGLDPAQVQVDNDAFEFSVSQVTPIPQTLNITNIGEADLHYEVMADFLNLRGHGGPDNYGYQWYDSNALNGPIFNWIERTDAATELQFPSNDIAADPITMDFNFTFYGEEYSSLIVNPNGWIGFADDNEAWQNMNLPNPDSPLASICAFWDDLRPFDGTDGGGSVYYQCFPESLIVWFENVDHYSGDYEGTYDFQIIINEDDEIILQYNSMIGDLNTATIGIQNAEGNDGLMIVNNAEYVEDQMAIIIKKLENWIYINGNSGTIPMNETQTVNFVVLPAGLEPGVHTCSLLIGSNDPLNPIYSIPVTLEIQNTDSEDFEVPAITSLMGNYPNPFNPTTTIAFSLSKEDLDVSAQLTIYNLRGQKVKDFDFAPNSLDQYNEVIWDGKDNSQNPVASGVYFYRLDTHRKHISSKMILMK